MKCPICDYEKNFENFTCSDALCLKPKYGVFRYFENDFYQRLKTYETTFVKVREKEGLRIKNKAIYNELPFVDAVKYKGGWADKAIDLKIISQLVKGVAPKVRALNFGSYNGWLSNHLVKLGYKTTAAGYFMDEFDGLGSCQFYHNSWTSIQMDIEKHINKLDGQFDLIVLNRGVAFMTDLEFTLKNLIGKLSDGGILIVTGVKIFEKEDKAKKAFDKHLNRYKKQHGFNLMFKELKGYLNGNDFEMMKNLGLNFKTFPGKHLANLRSMFMRTKPLQYYAYFKKSD